MNIRFLETVLWLAKLRTIKATADQLCITHTAISSRIAALEQDLGVRLFEKSDQGFEPTPAGVRFIEEAGKIVESFPEHFDWHGGTVAQKIAAGEGYQGGPAYDMCRKLARDCGIHVHSGSFYEATPDKKRVYNTSVVFNPAGEEIGRYRKIHLFDIHTPDGMRYGESDAVAPGAESVVVDVHGFKLGLAICYDLRFPELFQQLMKKGANVIALPAAFTLQTGKDHWDVLCRARAIETQSYFLAAAMIGQFDQGGEKRHTYGHSLICDPWGHVVAKASDEVGPVSARLDKALIAKVREQIPLQSQKVL